jgi:hypothetical protein
MDRKRKDREHQPSVNSGTSGASAQLASGRPTGHLDPAHILGCNREQALQLFHGRPVTPGEAEAIAEESYHWRRHLHDPCSYWITTNETARILNLSPPQVKRLLDRGQLPHIRHVSRVRLMRRAQIVALADGRPPSIAY